MSRLTATNGPVFPSTYELTIDDLIRMMPEIERRFPKDDMPPNPADVHPATFAALSKVCEHREGQVPMWGFAPITLHVRTDVEPWKMHSCTCQAKAVRKRLGIK